MAAADDVFDAPLTVTPQLAAGSLRDAAAAGGIIPGQDGAWRPR
jgi:hypothetical protein